MIDLDPAGIEPGSRKFARAELPFKAAARVAAILVAHLERACDHCWNEVHDSTEAGFKRVIIGSALYLRLGTVVKFPGDHPAALLFAAL